MFANAGWWDLLLFLAVPIQATVIAYVYRPRHKALILSLPIPFTLATLAVGNEVDATNVLGLVLLLLFAFAVYLLHARWRLPVVPAIVVAAAGYCLVATWLRPMIPTADLAFWISTALTSALGATLYLTLPGRTERGHRSPLPVWCKLPLLMLVVLGLLLLKTRLGGFMTVFPMVTVITCYEARHSLWTLCRQVPIIMLTLLPLQIVTRLTTPRLGLGPALLVGWIVFLAMLIGLTRRQWRRDAAGLPPAKP